MSELNETTPTPRATKTPAQRSWRTFFQVLVGVLAAVPAAFTDVAPGWIIAITAGIAVVVSAGMNAYDQSTGRG